MSEFGTPSQIPLNKVEKKERRELVGKLKILIVEDQYYPQFNLLKAAKNNFGEYVKDFKNNQDVTIIDNFVDAQQASQRNDLSGVLVFLDNRMPLDPVDHSQQQPYMQKRTEREFGEGSFQLYEEDDDFSDNPLSDGYRLIDSFKSKGAIVVGTSSFSEQELRSKGLASPDFVIVKMEAEKSIGEMSEKILDAVEEKMREKAE